MLGAAGALGHELVFGSLAAAGDLRRVRTDLGIRPAPRRAACRKNALALAQLSDIHIVDHESPARVE